MMPPSKSPVMESAASEQNPAQQSQQQDEQSAKRACPLKFSIAKIMEPDHRPSKQYANFLARVLALCEIH